MLGLLLWFIFLPGLIRSGLGGEGGKQVAASVAGGGSLEPIDTPTPLPKESGGRDHLGLWQGPPSLLGWGVGG